jgi:hypothetical protein
MTFEFDRTAGRRQVASDQVQQRRFARAVWADHTEKLTSPQGEGKIVNRDQSAKAFGEVPDLKQVCLRSPAMSQQRAHAAYAYR